MKLCTKQCPVESLAASIIVSILTISMIMMSLNFWGGNGCSNPEIWYRITSL